MIVKKFFTELNNDIASHIYSYVYCNLDKEFEKHKIKSKQYIFLLDFKRSSEYYKENTIKLNIIYDIITINKLVKKNFNV